MFLKRYDFWAKLLDRFGVDLDERQLLFGTMTDYQCSRLSSSFTQPAPSSRIKEDVIVPLH